MIRGFRKTALYAINPGSLGTSTTLPLATAEYDENDALTMYISG
jgi:hypothetical protein